MGNILTIFKREIKAYFNSAIAYIFIIVFLLFAVGLFMAQFFIVSAADMRGFFYTLPLILCVFLPAVTMRLWAEDRKGNTLELLLTFPAKTYELVLGKFFASFLFYITALISTFTVPLMIALLGEPDFGVVACQYIGSILMGGFFLALGIFVSGFCKDQIVSFIVAMVVCFGFFLLGTDFTAGSIDGWIPGLGSFLKSSLGMMQHFAAFQKGVIDNRDFLYFITGVSIFLVLNAFWLETRLKPRAKAFFTTVCVISVGIFSLVNFIFSDLPIGRFDFTEGKAYTISESTHEILQDLKSPVTVKLFISPADKMPSMMNTLERNISDKLDEFKVAAKGNFDYKVFHMETANVAGEDEEGLEKSIQKKGIRPFQVQSIEADELGVKLVYSAMSIAYKEKPEQIIPRIVPQSLIDLEYIIASTIYKMTLKQPPSVALVAPYIEKVVDPEMKELLETLNQQEKEKLRDDDYELISQMLKYEGYKVSRIKLSEEEPIPEGVDTLIIIEPRELNERQRFEINRFLVNGGSVFLAVQRYNFQYSSFGEQGLQITSEDRKPQINQLLESWGLGVSKDFLMDTQADVVSLTGGRIFGVFEVSSPVMLPIQLKIVSEQMNKDISITSRLSTVLYLWGSALSIDYEKLASLNLTSETLFNSSPDAWQVVYHGGDLTNNDLDVYAVQERKAFPLAVFVKGQFSDAFKDREIPAWPREEADAEESYEQPEEEIGLIPKPGKMILIGGAKMFSKQLFDKGAHMPLFLNSVDALTLGEKLIKIRSKQLRVRSLKSLSSVTKAGWRIFVTFFVPIILCIIGGLRIFLRKRSKWSYFKSI
ncbi:MAG: Gldg family protein [Candidatus Omnitrophota bacterium]